MKQEHSGSGDNVAGDKHEHHYNTHKTPSQLTSKLGKDTIIGRAKELQKIDTLLKKYLPKFNFKKIILTIIL
jgi:hypothetical protein